MAADRPPAPATILGCLALAGPAAALEPVEGVSWLRAPAALRLDGERCALADWEPAPLPGFAGIQEELRRPPVIDLALGAKAGPATDPDPDPETKVIWHQDPWFWGVNGGLIAGYTIYGIGAWDWGTGSFHFDNEHWFSAASKYGGADKAGHAFVAYGVSALFCELYDAWGYDRGTASALGALSGWTHTMIVEAGDGFSEEHGFSYEDGVANTVGAGLLYLRRTVPGLAETLDFRWEYLPSKGVRRGDNRDILTDYSGSKYVFVLKPDGIVHSGSWLRFLELHAGFYTRGYVAEDRPYIADRTQHWYVGVGVSITEVLGAFQAGRWRKVFNYYQVPYTYVAHEWEREGPGGAPWGWPF